MNGQICRPYESPSLANEPPPDEASWTPFSNSTQALQYCTEHKEALAGGGSFAPQGGLLGQQG